MTAKYKYFPAVQYNLSHFRYCLLNLNNIYFFTVKEFLFFI